MNRLRAFDFPHKALRNIISQFTFMAETIDYSSQPELDRLKQLGNDMFSLLEDHVQHEENHTFRHIENKLPGKCKFEMDDHERVEKFQNELQNKLNNPIENPHDFYLETCKFQSIYFEHIHHEETVTEKIIWELFTDEELIEQRVEIMKNIEPSMLMKWFGYGIPASNISDSIAMLQGFKQGVPQEVFNAALSAIEEKMPEERMKLLVAGLN